MTISACSTVLFQNNPHLIKLTCQTKIIPKDKSTFIKQLDQGQIIIRTREQTWVQSCQGKPPKLLTPHSYVILTLPCQCTLTIGDYIIPSKTHFCSNFNDSSIAHPLNLQFLTAMFDTNKLPEISGKDLFQNKPIFNLPDIHF